MKHPKSENVLKVVNNFKKALAFKGKLNMSEGKVNQHHKCGTVHCHGGWYAVVACDTTNPVLTFMDGRAALENHLEVDKIDGSYGDIRCWAKLHPKIWGNDWGYRMFHSDITDSNGEVKGSMAFYHPKKRPMGAKKLQHIIDHWTEVYERILAWELEEKKKQLLTVPPIDELVASALKTPNECEMVY